eukprot:1160919-Pelagomonas_calceolata.AAC.3
MDDNPLNRGPIEQAPKKPQKRVQLPPSSVHSVVEQHVLLVLLRSADLFSVQPKELKSLHVDKTR